MIFRTAFCNGKFDVMHAGHFNLLSHANLMSGKLIVAIDSDKRIRKTNPMLPIIPQDFRKANLMALYANGGKLIDEVFIFNTDDELREIVRKNKVDVIVKGNDWQGKDIIGSEFAPVEYFRCTTNGLGTKISSSKIIEMVLAKYNNEEDNQ